MPRNGVVGRGPAATLTGQETSDGQSEGVVGAEAVGARFVVFVLLLGV
ncbi:MAG: hypothetical protein OXE43_01300 [Chloroflexi bacterium]|nr:hypothetical protein [Chloroflexota bacterium]